MPYSLLSTSQDLPSFFHSSALFLGTLLLMLHSASLWVPLQSSVPNRNRNPEQKNLKHTDPIFQVYCIICLSQTSSSSARISGVTPAPSLDARLTTSTKDGTERSHFRGGKEHAEKLDSGVEKQLTPSHTPPWKPPTHTHNPALCWPVSASEEASSTTKLQQHCPQMCGEQTTRGSTWASQKLLLGRRADFQRRGINQK